MIYLLKKETEEIMVKGCTTTYICWITNISHKKDHKAFSITRAKGGPYLFITTFCNPNNPHILAAIDKSMDTSGILDIVS